MKVVVQRVSRASVRVGGSTVATIGLGLLALAGFAPQDDEDALAWIAGKIRGLRVFDDRDGKMNLSLEDVGGELLVVSQFTLYGSVARGRRPSFVDAAQPEQAERLYERFVDLCREGTTPVATGRFGEMMEVDLVNDGPVTLIIER